MRKLILLMITGFFLSGQALAVDLPDFTELVKSNSPAVVNISTTQVIKRDTGMRMPQMPDLPEGMPFGEWFRHYFGEQGEGQGEREYQSQSLGSGFIIDKSGYVLTNHHVIKEADEIIVRLSDRRELVAEVLGVDERSDMALLKVEADDPLPVVTIGSSEGLKVGEWVLAIGSPFGFDHSVTAGIVSAKGRSLPRENYVPFIQTDVAINPGNSGGPLFNLDGEVVGINSQIYSRTGGFMGLSFAIPIDVAMEVAGQLKEQGYVKRGWLGILIQDVTRDLAEAFGMEKPEGALVAKVLPDSPAQAAGLQVGDVVIEFNGKPIANSASLPPIVGRTPVGEEVKVKIIREGERQTLKVELGELPSEDELKVSEAPQSSGKTNRLGIRVEELNAEQRQELELERPAIVVTQVDKGPAREAGVRPGDVILRINNQEVTTLVQFQSVVKDLPADRSVALLVQRRGSRVFLALKIRNGE